MGQLSIFALVGIIFAVMVIVVLIAVSINNLRKGQLALRRAHSVDQPAVWHKQLSILFGVNNLVFAGLIFFVLLLALVTDRTWKYIFIALIALFLVCSIILVMRCVFTALQTSRDLISSRRDKSS